MTGPDRPQKREAVHIGHADVGQQDMDGLPRDDLQGLAAVSAQPATSMPYCS
jgi:hypothetical protein